jgi:RHS repeat-associated protein
VCGWLGRGGAAFSAVLALWLALAAGAPACGCDAVVLRAHASTEKALIVYHAGTETIVPEIGVSDVRVGGAILFPVPGAPSVRVLRGVDDLFAQLGSATTGRRPARSAAAGSHAATAHTSTAVPRVIGAYEVAVLPAGSAAPLGGWLAGYGYALPRAARLILEGYARQHWRFVAIRLAAHQTGELRPLAISFRTRRIVYPMRLASVGAARTSLELFVNADGVAYPSGVPLGITLAGPVEHLGSRLPAAVRALLPGRFLTRLKATGLARHWIHGDLHFVLRTRLRRALLGGGTTATDGICGLCVLAPSGTSLTDTGNGALAVLGAPIAVDSAGRPAVTATGNATITAPSVGVVGTASATGNAKINNLTTGITPIPDPLAGVAAPSLARPASVPSVTVSVGSQTISPGVYQNISVTGNGSLTLNAGTYVILGQLTATGKGQVAGTAVTLYLACGSYPTPCSPGAKGAGVSLTGNGTFNLSAPTAGCLPLAIQSDPNNTSTISLTGNASDAVTGIIYAPSGSVALTGNGSTFKLAAHIIAGNAAALTGNGDITLSASNLIACTLTLSPASAGPISVGTAQELDATLLNSAGSPVPDQSVAFNVSGSNSATGSASTDASGVAKFTYEGTTVGTDTAQASITEGATILQSNMSTITWIKATPQISTTLSATAITTGDAVTDAATVSGGFSPTGSVSWNVYNATTDTTCQTPLNASPLTANLTGGSATSPSYTPSSPGTYQLVATYSGDQHNQQVSTGCGDPNEQVVVSPAVPPQMEPATTTLVKGNFYAEDPSQTTFVAQPGDIPAFSQTFPNIQFNPPKGTIQYTPASIDPTTRPFTDITTNVAGLFTGSIPAQGNSAQAGIGSLSSFDAEFEANFIVSQPGDVTFNVVADDGFLLGVGGGATRVSGAYENPPQSGTTPFNNYPLVGAFDQAGGTAPQTFPVTIHFPAAGSYPYELDYFECCGSQLSLTLGVASFTKQTSPLSVYVGYADGLRPAGSIFPFPWEGSPNVTFVGCPGCSYDSGALRFDNSSNAPIVLDSVTVDIGGNHFDLWPHGLTVPAGQILILAQTSQYDFDTSDYSGAGCGQNNGVIPQVTVTIGGVTTTYADKSQILNTFGYDLACQGNESQSWQRIGGGGTAINTPLPPAVSLALTPTAATDVVGQSQKLTVTATDGNGHAVSNLPVTLGLFGVNQQGSVTCADGSSQPCKTSSDGNASFSYVGQSAGTDTLTATAFITGLRAASNATSVTWNIPVPGGAGSGGSPAQAPPAISNVTPPDGTVVSKIVPVDATIIPPKGETISSWSVAYQAQDAEPPVTIAAGTGTPPSPLASFDPTTLPNDTYSIIVSATASGGGTQTFTSTVSVLGNLKLGRYVTTYQDLSVPVNGFQMEVRRTYDSYDKRVGDFGVGWHVSVDNFRTSANRQLGADGWTEYTTSCFILCSWAYKTSTPHFVTVTSPDGHQDVFDFTPAGPQNTLIDFAQGTAAFTARPGTGTTSKLEVADPLAQGFSYGFDGNLYGATGAIYNPTRFRLTTHDGRALVLDETLGLVSETDPNGNSLTLDQDGIHSSTGQSITYTRDSEGRITQITGPSGQTLGYTYSTAGDLASSTDPAGNTTTYTYDSDHNLLKMMGPGGQPLQTLTYGPGGRLTSVADANGNTTTIDNNAIGQQQAAIDPTGNLTTIYTFDDLGDVLQVQSVPKSGGSVTESFTYDSVGHLLSSTDPLGNKTTATYDSAGDPLTLTDPAGRSTTFSWNSDGQLLTTKDPLGTITQSVTYDSAGNPIRVDHADGSFLKLTYDSAGHPLTATDSAGRTTSFTYDSFGRLVSTTNALGGVTTYQRDASGNLVGLTDPAGDNTSYTLDANGNITGITDALGHHWSFGYDSLGRQTSSTDPLGAQAGVTYDPTGLPLSETDRDGSTTSYTYDADGRLITATTSAGTATITRDDFGRPSSASNATGIVAFTYDADSHVTKETDSGAVGIGIPTTSTTSSYNSAGQVTTRAGVNGTTQYGYDADGRLTSTTDGAGRRFTLGYDPMSRLTSLTQPDGLLDSLTYDNTGQLVGRIATLGASTIATWSATRDANGNILTETGQTGTTDYTYDAAGRLMSASGPSGTATYSYDASGDRTSGPGQPSGSFTYDADGRLLQDASATYTYDADGRLLTRTDKATGQATTYQWDPRGELSAIKGAAGTTTYRYDPLGRRVQTTTASGTQSFAYDDQNLAASFGSSTTPQATYLSLPGYDQPLEATAGSTTDYYLQDGRGDISALTDSAGNVLDSYKYSPFGVPTVTGSTPNPFAFAGREYDPATGLVYERSRYYDPSQGRFLSPDPVFSLSPYQYAGDNPINYIDPSGNLLAEYAPLLPQQLSGAIAIGKINNCIGLALLVGLAGNADEARDLVCAGFGHYSDLIPVPPELLNGGQINDWQSGVEQGEGIVDQANGAHAILTSAPPDRSTFIPISGGLDPSLWEPSGPDGRPVVINPDKPWPQPDTPAGRFAYLPAEEAPDRFDQAIGAASDAFSFLDLYNFLREVTQFSCPN